MYNNYDIIQHKMRLTDWQRKSTKTNETKEIKFKRHYGEYDYNNNN